MPDPRESQITELEIREAELQMTGRPPSGATGFIGFVPAAPAAPPAPAPPPASSSNAS
jgi:hypothetical protein